MSERLYKCIYSIIPQPAGVFYRQISKSPPPPSPHFRPTLSWLWHSWYMYTIFSCGGRYPHSSRSLTDQTAQVVLSALAGSVASGRLTVWPRHLHPAVLAEDAQALRDDADRVPVLVFPHPVPSAHDFRAGLEQLLQTIDVETSIVDTGWTKNCARSTETPSVTQETIDLIFSNINAVPM